MNLFLSDILSLLLCQIRSTLPAIQFLVICGDSFLTIRVFVMFLILFVPKAVYDCKSLWASHKYFLTILHMSMVSANRKQRKSLTRPVTQISCYYHINRQFKTILACNILYLVSIKRDAFTMLKTFMPFMPRPLR